MRGGERRNQWNIVKQNHPYDTSSNFPGQAKESIARIEMYGYNYKFNA